MRITIAITASAALALLASGAARADRRSFIRAYEVATQPRGNLELEIWNDIVGPDSTSPFADAQTVHRVELEYGLTDRWDLALYHQFTNGGPRDALLGTRPGFRFDAWQLETRLRPAERGEWPVDVMFYLETERPVDFGEPWELEGKVILGKDVGAWGFVANLVAEQKLRGGNDPEFELDLGARYEFLPQLRLGAELWRHWETEGGKRHDRTFAGPSVSVAGERVWLQLGAGIGLGVFGDGTSQPFVRSVLGFNL